MLEVNDLGHIDLGQSPEALQATALAADYLASVHRHDEIAIAMLKFRIQPRVWFSIKPLCAIWKLHKLWRENTKVLCFGP